MKTKENYKKSQREQFSLVPLKREYWVWHYSYLMAQYKLLASQLASIVVQ